MPGNSMALYTRRKKVVKISYPSGLSRATAWTCDDFAFIREEIRFTFSRKQELEADRIGVILMNKAGYNPLGALEFWKRMKHWRKGKEPIVYLSTHPVDDTRIAHIEKILQNQNAQK
jgi:predicted Zn-dependent protease